MASQKMARNLRKRYCECCGSSKKLQAHHINNDSGDTRKANIQTLCRYCHAHWHRLHHQLNMKTRVPMPSMLDQMGLEVEERETVATNIIDTVARIIKTEEREKARKEQRQRSRRKKNVSDIVEESADIDLLDDGERETIVAVQAGRRALQRRPLIRRALPVGGGNGNGNGNGKNGNKGVG